MVIQSDRQIIDPSSEIPDIASYLDSPPQIMGFCTRGSRLDFDVGFDCSRFFIHSFYSVVLRIAERFKVITLSKYSMGASGS